MKLQRRTENDFLKDTLFLEIPATEVTLILYAVLLSRKDSKWNDQWLIMKESYCTNVLSP